MTSLFPGMDPYLEGPTHWSDFHHEFISTMRNALAGNLPANYHARISELVMMIQPELPRPRAVGPDVLVTRDAGASSKGGVAVAGAIEIQPATLNNIELLDPHTEGFIEVIRLPSQQVVTVIELLSPINETGDGRGVYMEKRYQLLRQPVSIVEIDLIRAGRRLSFDRPLPEGHYYAFVSRAERRPYCDVHPWTVRQALPRIPIPLLPADGDVWLDLAVAFEAAYERGRYAELVEYDQPPPAPAFSDEDAQWVIERVKRSQG